jgi:hypothetical protein
MRGGRRCDCGGALRVALIVCYAGEFEEGERVVRPISEFGTPALDVVMRKPYVAHQKMFNLAVPSGLHYYWKGTASHLSPMRSSTFS